MEGLGDEDKLFPLRAQSVTDRKQFIGMRVPHNPAPPLTKALIWVETKSPPSKHSFHHFWMILQDAWRETHAHICGKSTRKQICKTPHLQLYFFSLLLLFLSYFLGMVHDSFCDINVCVFLLIFFNVVHAVIADVTEECFPIQSINFLKDSRAITDIMMWRRDDEGFVRGSTCLMAPCNLWVDILPHVPMKPINVLLNLTLI